AAGHGRPSAAPRRAAARCRRRPPREVRRRGPGGRFARARPIGLAHRVPPPGREPAARSAHRLRPALLPTSRETARTPRFLEDAASCSLPRCCADGLRASAGLATSYGTFVFTLVSSRFSARCYSSGGVIHQGLFITAGFFSKAPNPAIMAGDAALHIYSEN